jgi:hypothetical protein
MAGLLGSGWGEGDYRDCGSSRAAERGGKAFSWVFIKVNW